jgi:hypothetical protein
MRRSLFLKARTNLQLSAATIALGIAAIVFAQIAYRGACRIADIDYHTRFGYSFAFRLNFVGRLSASERESVLARAAAHSSSPNVPPVLEALRTTPPAPFVFNAMDLIARAQNLLPPEGAGSMDATDAALNETARAFLIAPSPAYFRAVERDCLAALRTSVTGIVAQLVTSTSYYFVEPARMPQFAQLSAFRDPGTPAKLTEYRDSRFLRIWRKVSYQRLLLGWAVLLVLVARRKSLARKPELLGYAIALTVVGILGTIGNNLVNEFQDRYTMPAWALTVVSLTLLAGALAKQRSAGRLIEPG